jgi:signal transduction histidine kinase/phage shock protein PspC (stress-responsive transcriptional regulator)
MLAGVCAGIARALNLDPVVVRIAFGVATLAWGIGLVVYGVAWLLMPTPRGGTIAGRLLGRPGSVEVATGIGLLVMSVLLLLRASGFWISDAIVWPIAAAAAGVALLWRPSLATSAPAPARGPAPPLLGGRARSAVALGAALVVGAALLFLWANGALDAAGDVVLAGVVVLAAVALILAPLWWRLGRSLAAERAERIRSEERADLAAHLHDSVLQTLALVQRRADNPREVAALARAQERELRAWLHNRPAAEGGSLTTALEEAAAEIEAGHDATVEVVVAGDAALDARTEPIVAAAREAILNAAKFAGHAGPIDVFAETTPDSISVFVRDRGPGFDRAVVPGERRGVRDSIVGRMERNGGRASIRSSAETGTEVELSIPRADK